MDFLGNRASTCAAKKNQGQRCISRTAALHFHALRSESGAARGGASPLSDAFLLKSPRVTTALRGYAAAIFRRAAPPARRVCLVAPKYPPTIFRLTSPKPLCPLRGKGVYGSLAIALTG